MYSMFVNFFFIIGKLLVSKTCKLVSGHLCNCLLRSFVDSSMERKTDSGGIFSWVIVLPCGQWFSLHVCQ